MHVFRSLVLSLTLLLFSRYLYRRLSKGTWQPGTVALITGGGSGLGLELAKALSRAGCRIVLVGRNEEALKEASFQCKRAGAPSSHVIVSDLSTVEGVRVVERDFKALHEGQLKYLVLNAGAGAIVPFTSDERFTKICEDMMNINYFSNVWLLQLFLPQLHKNHRSLSPSRIVVISSLAGVLPSILRSPYTASKHAIQGFMNALRGETCVHITLCCPNYIDTEFHRRVLTADGLPLLGHQRRGMSSSQCALECLEGSLHGDAEVIISFLGKLAYTLRPSFTSLVDFFVKRNCLKSIKCE